MIDWWRRVTKRDTPRQRYNLARFRGESEESARHTVASSYGLTTNVIRLTGDGQEKTVTIPWTVEDVSRLLFYQWMYRQDRLTESISPAAAAVTTP